MPMWLSFEDTFVYYLIEEILQLFSLRRVHAFLNIY